MVSAPCTDPPEAELARTLAYPDGLDSLILKVTAFTPTMSKVIFQVPPSPLVAPPTPRQLPFTWAEMLI